MSANRDTSGKRRSVNRDFYSLQMDGYDQHFSLKDGLNPLFSELNDAIAGFRKALKNVDIWDLVTIVVTSEFGRRWVTIFISLQTSRDVGVLLFRPSITQNASGGLE